MSSTSPIDNLATGSIACPNCRASNDPSAKFCASCGESQFQQCKKCENPVRIGTDFCSNCGANLAQEFKDHRDQLIDILRQARDEGRAHRYDDAIYLAESCLNVPDFRYGTVLAKANQLIAKLRERQSKYQQLIDDAVPKAQAAYAQGNMVRAAELLKTLPPELLDDDTRALLKRSEQSFNEEQQLYESLRKSVAEKNLESAGAQIDQLLQIKPDDENYKRLGLQIGNELLKQAVKHFDRLEHSLASEKLDFVPVVAQREDYRKVRAILDESMWLRDHIRYYPFASPTLVALSNKLVKLSSDASTTQMVQDVTQRHQSDEVDPRGVYPRWAKFESQFWKCEPNFLVKPQSIQGVDVGDIPSAPLRFSTAIGLALQSIGLGDLQFSFGGQHKQTGLMGLLSKGKKSQPEIGWGIDIGPSAIRAVRMERSDDDRPLITQAVCSTYEQPICRPTNKMGGTELVRKHLEQLLETYPLKEEPVWISLSGRQTLGRFLEMPPLDAKKLSKLVDTEFDQLFPVPKDQLAAQHWHATKPAKTQTEPVYTGLIGIRSFIVEQQVAMLAEVGIEPAGLQVEPVALANLAMYEFREELSCDAGTETPPAVMILDVGVESTNVVVCTAKRFWFRSFDIAGDTFSGAIAKHLKIPIGSADLVKEQIAEQPLMHPVYGVLEPQFDSFNVRLRQLFAACRKDLGDFSLKGIWCTGGGCQMHGFIKSALADRV